MYRMYSKYKRYRIYWRSIGYIGYIAHTRNIPPVNELIIQRKRKRDGRINSRFEWQIQLNNQDVDKHITCSSSSCGHFALGTFSKTYLKEFVFKINVSTKAKTPTIAESTNVKCVTKHTNRNSS